MSELGFTILGALLFFVIATILGIVVAGRTQALSLKLGYDLSGAWIAIIGATPPVAFGVAWLHGLVYAQDDLSVAARPFGWASIAGGFVVLAIALVGAVHDAMTPEDKHYE